MNKAYLSNRGYLSNPVWTQLHLQPPLVSNIVKYCYFILVIPKQLSLATPFELNRISGQGPLLVSDIVKYCYFLLVIS